MLDISIHPFFIIIVFACIAFAYSSVGLGGGSSYTALMALFGVSYLAIPTISLALNLLVTSVGSFNFIRKKHARLRLILPFLVGSIPMAYVGGMLSMPKELFYWILMVTLMFVAFRIYLGDKVTLSLSLSMHRKVALSLLSGGILGLIAGIVGIGGGIYLVPLILVLGLGTPKEAAACGAIFVWLNSISGLAARIQHDALDMSMFFPLIGAVLIGGVLGSYLGSSQFKSKTMERILGGVILVAIFFLSKKLLLS